VRALSVVLYVLALVELHAQRGPTMQAIRLSWFEKKQGVWFVQPTPNDLKTQRWLAGAVPVSEEFTLSTVLLRCFSHPGLAINALRTGDVPGVPELGDDHDTVIAAGTELSRAWFHGPVFVDSNFDDDLPSPALGLRVTPANQECTQGDCCDTGACFDGLEGQLAPRADLVRYVREARARAQAQQVVRSVYGREALTSVIVDRNIANLDPCPERIHTNHFRHVYAQRSYDVWYNQDQHDLNGMGSPFLGQAWGAFVHTASDRMGTGPDQFEWTYCARPCSHLTHQAAAAQYLTAEQRRAQDTDDGGGAGALEPLALFI